MSTNNHIKGFWTGRRRTRKKTLERMMEKVSELTKLEKQPRLL